MLTLTGGSVDLEILTDISGYESSSDTKTLAIEQTGGHPSYAGAEKIRVSMDGPSLNGLDFGRVGGHMHRLIGLDTLTVALWCVGKEHTFAGGSTGRTTSLRVDGYLDFALDAAASLLVQMEHGKHFASFQLDAAAVAMVPQPLSPHYLATVAVDAGAHRLDFELLHAATDSREGLALFEFQ